MKNAADWKNDKKQNKKKKIAVLANGWSYDALSHAMEGILRYAKQEDFDIFTFLNHASYSEHKELMQGELNIFRLCDPADYDGVIVFSTMLNSAETAIAQCRKAKEKGIPVVSIGMAMDGIPSISVSNEEGMRELVTHLVEDHGVKKVFFVGGTPDHIDSNERLRVTREVLSEHGLPLAENQIGYGKWSNRYTAELLNRFTASEEKLPDAFVCANDIMALALATELERRGFRVPEDVIVTGFDSIQEGKYFYPALTTVRQDYEAVGYRACEMIYQKSPEEKTSENIKIQCAMVRGESCGCKGDEDYEAIRIRYCRHSYQRSFNDKFLDQNERTLRRVIYDVTDYSSLKSKLQEYYDGHHEFEGNGFSIILNKEYFEDVLSSEKELMERGQEERLEVAVKVSEKDRGEISSLAPGELVPGYCKKPDRQQLYYFCPLHFYEYNYGYVLFEDTPYILKENLLYPYLERIQQSLKLLRTNLRLKLLYDIDPMTGLYNRFGYENRALPLYQESITNGRPMMVMFVDINHMKWINDQYGHLHGDKAIKLVAGAIRENLEDHWIAVRFGGDEFLIIAPNCSEDEAFDLKKKILAYLKKKNRAGMGLYQITASCGYVLTDPKTAGEKKLQDYIKEADQLMYRIKQELHAQEEKEAVYI